MNLFFKKLKINLNSYLQCMSIFSNKIFKRTVSVFCLLALLYTGASLCKAAIEDCGMKENSCCCSHEGKTEKGQTSLKADCCCVISETSQKQPAESTQIITRTDNNHKQTFHIINNESVFSVIKTGFINSRLEDHRRFTPENIYLKNSNFRI